MAPTTTYPTPDHQATHQHHLDDEVDALAANLADETDPASPRRARRAHRAEDAAPRGRPRDALHAAVASRPTTSSRWPAPRWSRRSDRYRPGAGPGFAAFAHPTISGELKRWFRDHGWAVRPPRRIQELRAGLVVEEERLRHALNRDPHDVELARVLGVSVAEVDEARGRLGRLPRRVPRRPRPRPARPGRPRARHLEPLRAPSSCATPCASPWPASPSASAWCSACATSTSSPRARSGSRSA